MSGPDVPEPDMPGADQFGAGAPGLPGEALDALLEGNLLAAGAAAGPEITPRLQEVAGLLAALTAAPSADELAGHDQALTAFRRMRQATAPPHPSPADASPRASGTAPAEGQPARRKRRRPAALLPIRAAAAGAVTTLGALTAAAYLGVLPAPMQRLAHDTIGAPIPATHRPGTPPSSPPRQASPSTSISSPSPSPVTVPSTPLQASSPSSTRPASSPPATAPAGATLPGAAGLCDAYAHASPSARKHSAAFRRLIAAAGGQAKVPAYCAVVTGSPSP